ncbi:MAG TPA: HD domain-containing protein [Gemmatimonadaceae bacterium]|jgi:(p)ppGpp synthase/HD superfamily hydrolase
MTSPGYSDRVNHALAFAAKHHDQQVRRGTRAPYATHSANVAIILTRYQRDDTAVVAGILFQVVEDYVLQGYSAETLDQRVASKFGQPVLALVLAVIERRIDDDGVELSPDERRDDALARLAEASDDARWVGAAQVLHDAGTLLADLRRTIDPGTVWTRFAGGPVETVRGYRRAVDRLRELGFRAEIMTELEDVVSALETASRDQPVGS